MFAVALFDGRGRHAWRDGAIARVSMHPRKGGFDNMKEPPRESRDRQAKQAKSYIESFFGKRLVTKDANVLFGWKTDIGEWKMSTPYPPF